MALFSHCPVLLKLHILNLVREFILHDIHLGLMCNSVLVVSLCTKLFYMLDILGTFYSVYVFS